MSEKHSAEWAWFLALFGVCVLVGVALAQWRQRAGEPPSAPTVGPRAVETAEKKEKAAPQLVWIEGRVLGADGSAVAGAQVRARRLGRLEPGATAEFVGETDAAGKFRLGPTRKLGHELDVSAGGFAEQRVARAVPGGALEVKLVELGGMRGRVLHEGRGLPGAELLVGGPGLWPPIEARSGEEGRFVTPPLEAGELQVWVRHPGLGQGPLGALAWVQYDAQDEVEVPVEAAGSLSVKVVSEATGEPIPGALVTLAEDVVHVMALTEWSDGLGKTGFVGLSGLRYVASARAYGFVPASQEVRVEPGSGEAVLRLAPAGKVGGQVLGPDGAPLELAQVVAHVITPEGQQWVLSRDTTAQVDKREAPSGLMAPSMEVAFGFFSDEEGRFLVTGVPGGRVILEVKAPGFAPGFAGPLELEAGGWVEAAPVTLGVGRPLRGVVVGPEGEPILGAHVSAGPADGPRIEGGALGRAIVEQVLVTDEQGRFEGSDLPREVEVKASAEGFLGAEGKYDLEVLEGEEVRLVLGLPGNATRGQVSLEGEVALEGVYVRYIAGPGQPDLRGDACSAVTDGAGRFLLAGCPDEPFWVSLEPPGLEAAQGYARLEPGEDAQVSLPSAGAVEVKARDVELEPLVGVELSLRRLDEPGWPSLAGAALVGAGRDGLGGRGGARGLGAGALGAGRHARGVSGAEGGGERGARARGGGARHGGGAGGGAGGGGSAAAAHRGGAPEGVCAARGGGRAGVGAGERAAGAGGVELGGGRGTEGGGGPRRGGARGAEVGGGGGGEDGGEEGW